MLGLSVSCLYSHTCDCVRENVRSPGTDSIFCVWLLFGEGQLNDELTQLNETGSWFDGMEGTKVVWFNCFSATEPWKQCTKFTQHIIWEHLCLPLALTGQSGDSRGMTTGMHQVRSWLNSLKLGLGRRRISRKILDVWNRKPHPMALVHLKPQRSCFLSSVSTVLSLRILWGGGRLEPFRSDCPLGVFGQGSTLLGECTSAPHDPRPHLFSSLSLFLLASFSLSLLWVSQALIILRNRAAPLCHAQSMSLCVRESQKDSKESFSP